MPTISRLSMYPVLILAFLLQATILEKIKIFGSSPDLLLVLVIFFGFFFGARAGLEAGLLAGLLLDIFSFGVFGLNTSALLFTGLLAGALNRRLFSESVLTQFLLVLTLSSFYMMLYRFLVSVFREQPVIRTSDYIISSVIPAGIYTAIIAIPIFAKFIDLYCLKESDYIL